MQVSYGGESTEWNGSRNTVSNASTRSHHLLTKVARVSPDAYIQQALQLAWYRDQGYATATYETASTRMMLHGRTDVIRTLSVESRAFVKSMLDDKSDVSRADTAERVKAESAGRHAISTVSRGELSTHGSDSSILIGSRLGSAPDGPQSHVARRRDTSAI